MTHEEFQKEFNKRIANRWLNHVYTFKSKATPKEIREWNMLPAELLMSTFEAGAAIGVKVFSEIIQEEKKTS